MKSSIVLNQTSDESLESNDSSSNSSSNDGKNFDDHINGRSLFPFTALQLRYVAFLQLTIGLLVMPVCLYYALT